MDGASDALTDGASDAKATVPCPLNAFCDSFERTTILGPWDSTAANLGATLHIDATTSSDGSSSLRVDLPTSTASSTEATLLKEFSPSANKITVSYAIRLGAAPEREVHVAALYAKTPTRYVFLNIASSGALAVVAQDATSPDYFAYPAGSLGFGAWHDVRIELTAPTASPSSVKLFVDEALRVDRAIDVAMSSASYTLAFGVTYAKAGPATSVGLDAVVLR